MSPVKNIPTRTNLMKLKRERQFAREGHQLLDQKRQILIVELMSLVDKTVDARENVEKNLADAYDALQNAVIRMGRNQVKEIAPAVHVKSNIAINMRRIMGVNTPQVDVKIRSKAPYFSLVNTSFWIDESISRFKGLLEDLARLAQLQITLMRIADEVQKTNRRVNALEKIAIPEYDKTLKYIEESLEESERESFAMLKQVKHMLEKKKGQ